VESAAAIRARLDDVLERLEAIERRVASVQPRAAAPSGADPREDVQWPWK
jgi:hypothetical protein